MGYDFKTTDFTATLAVDVGNKEEYTAVSPLTKQLNCDEYWTLASATAKSNVKCVRQTVIFDGPMNKADIAGTVKDDVSIGYREMAIGAGWTLLKPTTTLSNTYFALTTNYFEQQAPSLMTFSPQTVDFARFLEAEPDTNFISATKTSLSAASILAMAFATLF